MASAADVPHVYDVVLNGQGYVFLDTITPNLPFRTHKATYKISPTFIQRSNVTGAFGDNQQDWWLTASQNDWSLGEEQKFYRQGDQTSRSRYWRGMNVDLTTPGQATIGNPTQTLTFPSAVNSLVFAPSASATLFYAAGTKDLFSVDAAGTTVTALGSHGASTAPTTIAFDGARIYMSASSSASGVIKYDTNPPHGFSTFSACPASSLAYLNNTLYGSISMAGVVNSFARYDSAGNITNIQQWKTAEGSVFAGNKSFVLLPFGGRMLIMRVFETPLANEMWIYDGVSVSQLAIFEPNFIFQNWCVAEGVVFIAGVAVRNDKSRYELRYYANGSFGVAYATQLATNVSQSSCAVTPFGTGVLFTEPVNNAVMYFDLAQGSASSVAPFTPAAGTTMLAAGSKVGFYHQGVTAGTTVFASGVASAASLQTSMFDFETSLPKFVRSVQVDYSLPEGGSVSDNNVDLYYQTDDLQSTATYPITFLASNVQSGVPYSLNISCHAISILAVLKRNHNLSPALKRIYVRAAPSLQTFQQREYVLDCTGDPSEAVRELRDGTPMPIDGGSQAASLIALAENTTPFTITDRFGSFTGLVDLNDPEGLEVYEVHASQYVPGTTGNFVVRVKLREV